MACDNLVLSFWKICDKVGPHFFSRSGGTSCRRRRPQVLVLSSSPSMCRARREACLRIVDVRGIMGRACAKQWGAHVQSNGLRMCKAMACAWRWLYLLANTSAPLKDQSLMLSLSCMDMVSPDKLSRLLLSMKPVQLNNLSASVLVAKTQRYFLASLHRLGNCGLLGLNQSKGSSPSSRAFSERSCLLLLC